MSLRGTLARLPWVPVTRKSASKSARNDKLVYGIRSSEDIAEAFGRRERDSRES